MTVRDQWWLRQFMRLLNRERDGVDPLALASRWLLLLMRCPPGRRWQVSFAIPSSIYHLLDDADIRARNRRYAEHQWAAAQEWLNA